MAGISAPSVFGPFEAFRWTPQGGMVRIAPTIGSPFEETYAEGISGNGLSIVGHGYSSAAGTRPWRWTEETGMEDLGRPSGATSGSLALTNFDGRVAVGDMSFPTSQNVPYLWNENTGYMPLLDYFAANGVVFPPGYNRFTVAGISDDGLTFAGGCSNLQQSLPLRGWIVTVPTPGSACIPLCALAYTRRSRSSSAIHS